MDSSNEITHEENYSSGYEYVESTLTGDSLTQMKAVRTFISHFSPQSDVEMDHLFIKNFPIELYGEFTWISQGGKTVDQYKEKTILFFDVFTFIYRNDSLVLDRKAKSFIVLLLNFMKTRESIPDFDANPLIVSILNCISHDPNKVLFINDNGMFNFYFYFITSNFELIERFWTMTYYIYHLDPSNRPYLNPKMLTKNMNEIKSKFQTSHDENIKRLFLNFLKMLSRLQLFDEIEIDVTNLYDITISILIDHINGIPNFLFIEYLSKIWSRIFSYSKYRFRIDTTDKLIHISGLFSTNLSHKLMEVVGRKSEFKMTKFKEQRLYIIFFSLVAFPTIDHDKFKWLHGLLIQLHASFIFFLQKCSIEDLLIENEYLILQYFVKSRITVGMEISSNNEEDIFNSFFNRFGTYPSLKFHLLYLDCRMYVEFRDMSTHYWEITSSHIDKIKDFVKYFTLALSDRVYIHKIKTDKKLFMYENLSKDLTMISENFIKYVFSECESKIIDELNLWMPEYIGCDEYKIYTKIFTSLVSSFNDSNYVTENMADYFLMCADSDSSILSQNPINIDSSGHSHDSKKNFGPLEHVYSSHQPSFLCVLRWFMLIYEMKFIFGDINYKFTNMTFFD
ncbi:hypothetical protein RF11_07555 [Thelohanellus kitauei]|uniref:Uncharacterized protein n=1 Tax=Thelohanellus kitauei TaxID=669202 RepID=A0A0C2MIV9_THEKT|nr:hypothetical protein RF11_07555 [Thelohanellus kitauei]